MRDEDRKRIAWYDAQYSEFMERMLNDDWTLGATVFDFSSSTEDRWLRDLPCSETVH